MAEPSRRLSFWVGLFVGTSLVLLAALVVVYGSTPGLLAGRRNVYRINFDDAPGVALGSPVLRSGVRVGEVTDLDLDNESGRVRVVVELEPKYTPKANEEAVISRKALTGDASIEFLPRPIAKDGPPPDRTPIPPGSELEGRTFTDARRLLDQASDVLPNASQSLDSIRRSVERFEKLGPKLEEAITDFAAFARSARELMPEVRRTNDAVREFLTSKADGPKDVRALVGVGEEPQQPDQPRGGLKSTNERMQQAAERVEAAAASLQKSADQFNEWFGQNRNRLTEIVTGLDNVLSKENRANLAQSLKGLAGMLSDQNQRNVTDALAGLREIMGEPNRKNLTDALAGLRDLLNEKNRTNLAETIANARQISDGFKPVPKQTQDLLDQAQSAVKRVEGAAGQAESLLRNLQSTGAALNERGPNIVRNLDTVSGRLGTSFEDVGKTLASVQELLEAVGRADGTIQRLLSDPSLFQKAEQLLCDLTRLSPRLDRILQDAETFADKLARHPESIGLGGALRPSSGLKDAPIAPAPSRPHLLPGPH